MTMVEATTVAIGLLIAVDIGYFIKTAVYSLGPHLLPKIHPLKKSKLYGICTTRDIDFLLDHINNARYIRQMDFGRLNHLIRSRMLNHKYTGLGKEKILLAASTIRYRRSIRLFMPYKLETQVVYWDDKFLYYRQNFVSIHDSFVRAAAYTKLATTGVTPIDLLESSTSEPIVPLEAPEDLVEWIEHMKLNSESLRPSQ